MVPFSDLLRIHLDRLGLNQSDFARKVKVSRNTASKVIRGLAAPRWKRGEQWADALHLTGDEREAFLDAMHLAASPPRVPTIVSRLERRLKSR